MALVLARDALGDADEQHRSQHGQDEADDVELPDAAGADSFVPDIDVWSVHPASVVMVVAYLGGLQLIRSQNTGTMWEAVQTAETVVDEIDPGPDGPATSGRSMWTQFLLVGGVVAVGGWLIAEAAGYPVDATGLAAGFVGTVMGLVNALPEAVTAIAAVRRGAMTLAVAAVLGGNCLDALNLVAGDVAYRGRSIYHAVGSDQLFGTAAALLMTTRARRRTPRAPTARLGRIGFEGVTLILTYAAIARYRSEPDVQPAVDLESPNDDMGLR